MDKALLRRCAEVAHRAMEEGNHPFGALLADKDGNVIWANGAVASFGQADDAYGVDPFDVLGLSEPTFTLDASEGYDKYATVTPEGKLSLTQTGKDWLAGKNVVLKVKVNVYSRFGSVQGYNANDVIEVPVTF